MHLGGNFFWPLTAPAPTLSAEQHSSNARPAAALRKMRGVGDFPIFTAGAIDSDPGSGSGTSGRAIAEVADLIHQVHAGNPEQAKELLNRTVQGLKSEHGPALRAAPASAKPRGSHQTIRAGLAGGDGYMVAIGVAGEPTAPGRRNGGAVNRNLDRPRARSAAANSERCQSSPK